MASGARKPRLRGDQTVRQKGSTAAPHPDASFVLFLFFFLDTSDEMNLYYIFTLQPRKATLFLSLASPPPPLLPPLLPPNSFMLNCLLIVSPDFLYLDVELLSSGFPGFVGGMWCMHIL